jgi:sodium-dependent dicarboxylate transporter 2/3/5
MKKVSSRTSRILFAYGAITCFLSMWLSNTATTAMLYPIGMSILLALSGVVSRVKGKEVDIHHLRYGTGLMLMVAYASSIGGMGTPVGTPPNLIAIGQLSKFVNIRIPFFQWMMIALPITWIMFFILYYYLNRVLPAEIEEITESKAFIEEEKKKLGKWTRGEKNCLFAFLFTVTLWVTPGFIAIIYGTNSPVYSVYQRLFPEGVAALLGATLLFILPVNWKERQFTISWSTAVNIDWGTLLLFGGGLSLGEFMFKTNLAHVIGDGLISITGVSSWWAITALFTFLSVVITETTSNTAAATMVCPLAIASAQAAGVNPVAPAIASALGASMAFMLPISTPPNAIIYGSGCVPITQMIRHGFVLDLIGYVVVTGGVLFMCSLLGLH